MTKIEQNVKELIEPIINDIGYKVYDVIYEKEGKDNYLRIFIDKDDKVIDLNDCESVNNAITDILDERDLIKSSYMLEISSPGLERRIRSDEHLEMALNKEIEVHTFKPVDENKKDKIFKGILQAFDDTTITLDDITINKNNISNMKTVYNWED